MFQLLIVACIFFQFNCCGPEIGDYDFADDAVVKRSCGNDYASREVK